MEEIKLWAVETREHLATLNGHKHRIFSMSFSPDGTVFASGAEEDTVKLWEVATRKRIATFQHTGNVFSVAFSLDGETLAAATGKNVKLWDIQQREISPR